MVVYLHEGLPLPKMLSHLEGSCPSFCVQVQNKGARAQSDMSLAASSGSLPHVAGAILTVINRAALIRNDHHRVVIRSEDPDQSIHIVIHPTCQVVPNDSGHWGDGGVEVEVGIDVLEMTKNA